MFVHLDRSGVVSSPQKLPVRPELRAVGNVVETADAPYLLARCARVKRDVRRASHGKIMRRRFAEVYAGHRRIVGLKNRENRKNGG